MLFKCGNHVSSLAGWRCTACRATLCAECTGLKISGTARLEVCARCGGFASPLLVPRSELHPFSAAQLRGTLRWPLTGPGLISIGTSALFLTVLGVFGGKGTAIAVGITVAYLFQIVRHTAHGHDDVPGPADFRSYADDVIAPSFRLTLALAWIWAPALAWTLLHRAPQPDFADQQRAALRQAMRPGGPGLRVHGLRAVTTPTGIEMVDANAPTPPPDARQQEQLKQEDAAAATTLDDPAPKPASRSPLVPILLVVLGALIVPMSLIASALQTPLLVTVNPAVMIGYALKLGRDYLLLAGFCLGAAAAALVLRTGVQLVVGGGFLSRLPANLVTLAAAFVAFRAIGLLVRSRGDDLGYGHADFYLVRVLGEATPRYGVREASPVEPAPPPALPISPAEAFARLLAQKDVEGMLALLDQSGKEVPHALLTARAWMDLSEQAWQRKKGKAAAVALRRCLDAEPEGPLAPRAWLLAARVYAEALGDKATSDRLCQELVKRFPDSEPAKIAAQRLARNAGAL